MSGASGGLTICRTQANGARLPAPTPAMAGEVKPFLLATPGARCRPLIVIYLGGKVIGLRLA